MSELTWIGIDNSGDRVWELPSGQWTWGDTEAEAAGRERRMSPTRYEEKYGPIRGVTEMSTDERMFWEPEGSENDGA